MKLTGAKLIWPLQRPTVGVRCGGQWRSVQSEDCWCGERWLFCTSMRNYTALVYIYTHTHTQKLLFNIYHISVYIVYVSEERRKLRQGMKAKDAKKKKIENDVVGWVKKKVRFIYLLYIYIYIYIVRTYVELVRTYVIVNWLILCQNTFYL